MGSLRRESSALVPRTGFLDWRQAIAHLADALRRVLRDDPKPPRWDDVWMLGNAIASIGNPKAPEFDTTEYAYRFTHGATNMFAGCVQMPHRMRIDGPDPIIGVPHIHVYSRTAGGTTASAKSVWRLRWRWYDAVGIQPSDWNSRTYTFTQTVSADRMQILSFGEVTASYTLGVSSLFKFELARLPGGGARLLYVDQADIHVEFDTDRGSQLETSKWDRT